MTPATTTARSAIDHLTCLRCGRRFAPDEVDYVCPDHGAEGILDVAYDLDRVAARTSTASLDADPRWDMWRYRALLPVAPDAPVPPLRVGGTPLYDAPRLATSLGLARLWVKDETVQPTGSLKDRASAVALVRAAARGAEVVTTASTGNAAAALAGLAASTGQRCVLFVPAAAPPAKIAQLQAYGATVVLVEDTYDAAFDLCLAVADRRGWYVRSTGYNPYMAEGKKTAAYEIAEQLHWQVPDVVAVGVGDGCIIGALHRGFADLVTLGWIEQVPRLLGVQATGSSYLVQAWEGGEDVADKPPAPASTVADSISAALPRDRLKAMRAVTATGGAFVAVTDEEILAAIPALARTTGVFAEPAGAAPLAGVRAAVARGLIRPDETVALIATGSGLKDVAAAMDAVAATDVHTYRVPADPEAVVEALETGAGT